MKYVDHVVIHVESGHGGQGAVSFRKEKYVPKGGPDGGDGGKGGDIIFKTSSKIHTLMDIHLNRIFKASSGKPGLPKRKAGAKGKDHYILVPPGTMIFDESHHLIADLVSDNQEFIAAYGGQGGRGNTHFANSYRQAPRYAQSGKKGESKELTIELRLIAEVGIIGIPNAGKSTLLKHLTNSNPKIGNYPFTTKFPNLGVIKTIDREIILADIPGLIQGASQGQGLGHDFLRHIDRTGFVVHLIPCTVDSTPEKCWELYTIINHELSEYTPTASQKHQIVVLTKIDLIRPDVLKSIIDFFQHNGVSLASISCHHHQGLDILKEVILNNVCKQH